MSILQQQLVQIASDVGKNYAQIRVKWASVLALSNKSICSAARNGGNVVIQCNFTGKQIEAPWGTAPAALALKLSQATA